MKLTRILLGCGLAAIASTAIPAAQATPLLSYYVTINTASLLGNADAPFSLDLQLVQGSGNVSNTVTLSNFSFTGGTAAGTPNYTDGSESGSLAGTLTLTNADANNEFAEAFSAGVTSIQFKVSETENSEEVTEDLATDDQFNVYLDDNNTSSGFVPTNATDGGDALLESPLFENATLSSVQTYSSQSPDAGVITTAAVPEPSSVGMLAMAAGAVGFAVRRFRRA
jgi:hypothetical protein